MADEELRELELSHQYGTGGGGRWTGSGGGYGRSPGGGGSLSHQRMAHQPSGGNRAAEAEDIMGRGVGTRGRSGLYYSPPGTSYTIVERPAMGQPRGTYLGASSSAAAANAVGKKRPISPEQVLKMLGQKTTPEPPAQPRRPVPPPPSLDQLTVRTVNMSRGPSDGSQSHGFGICVKGGAKDSGKYVISSLCCVIQYYQRQRNNYVHYADTT